MKAIIVDDEFNAREILQEQIRRNHPEIDIVALADSSRTGVEMIHKYKPDIVFLDVEMPGGSGFELLESLESIDFHIIFTTAYSEYALRAIKFSALDYILKPIDRNELSQAIAKAANSTPNYPLNDIRSVLESKNDTPTTLIIANRSDYEAVEIESIVYLLGEGNYTKFFFKDGTSKMTSKTIKEYEDLLDSNGFCRIHKSSIIRINSVVRYKKGDGGEVVLEGGTVLKVSRSRKEDFLKRWKG